MKQFSSVCSYQSHISVRHRNTELLLVVMDDGSIGIRAEDNSFIANFSTDEHGGDRTLSVANHEFLKVRLED